jgi:hypothetical protein
MVTHDVSKVLEFLPSVANRRSADVEVVRDDLLGGKLLLGMKRTLVDELPDRLGQAVVQRDWGWIE